MRSYHVAAALSVSLLALAGCNKSATSQNMAAVNADGAMPALPAAVPMQTSPATAIVPAPPIAALHPPRYVSMGRPSGSGDAYAYLDRAYDDEDAIGDAPPDYAYDYDNGERPWVWQTDYGDEQYAEPTDYGYRYYYYQPGADYPYLVRDRNYSYAFAGGALVAIYARNGALLPPDQFAAHRQDASRVFWRGQELYQGAQQRPHRGVVAANWAARSGQIAAAQTDWRDIRARQPAWQNYHAQHDVQQQQGWQAEHQQRQAAAQQFAGWRARGFTGAPPHVGAPGQAHPPVAAPAAAPVAAPHPAMAADRPGPAQVGAGHAPGERPMPPEHRGEPAPVAAHPQAPGRLPRANPQQEAEQEHEAQAQAMMEQRHAQAAAAAHQHAAEAHAPPHPNMAGEHRAEALAAGQREQAMMAQHAARQQQAAAGVAREHAMAAEHQAAMARPAMPAPMHAPPPRMEAPRMEAPRMPAPRMEAPHPAPPHADEHH